MKLGSLRTSGQGTALPRVWQARSAWDRGRGLLGRAPLEWDEGLWIEPCSSVHTVGMGYALDLAYLDAQGVIQKLVENVVPWRVSFGFGARTTLEMRGGQLQRCAWRVGDQLSWQEAAA